MKLEQEFVLLVMFYAYDHQIIAYLTNSQQIVKQHFSNIYQKLKDITFLTFKYTPVDYE
jgi:ATP/maltotriose-dependent transcriptional regulator MalT